VDIKLSSNQFPWKLLIKHFADKGYVIWNYPEDVKFPGDETRGKGIHGLPVKAQMALLDAFDHPIYPIKLEHTYESGGNHFFQYKLFF